MSEHHVIETREPVVLEEHVVGVERVGQPTPDLNPTGGGCCFACSSNAIIRHFAHLAGLEPPTLEEVYGVWASDDVGAARGSSSISIEKFWQRWEWNHGPQRLETEQDPPISLPEPWRLMYAFGANLYDGDVLWKRVRTRLDAGWLVHVEMQSEAQSERDKRGEQRIGSDHVVVIDGYRSTETHQLSCSGPGHDAYWSGRIHRWFHVVDSRRKTPEPFWIEVDEWKENHGGFNMWFVRPKRERLVSFPPKLPCPLGHGSSAQHG